MSWNIHIDNGVFARKAKVNRYFVTNTKTRAGSFLGWILGVSQKACSMQKRVFRRTSKRTWIHSESTHSRYRETEHLELVASYYGSQNTFGEKKSLLCSFLRSRIYDIADRWAHIPTVFSKGTDGSKRHHDDIDRQRKL